MDNEYIPPPEDEGPPQETPADVKARQIAKHDALVKEPKAFIKLEAGKGFVPGDFDGLWRLARVISESSLCPKGLKQGTNTISNIVIACAQGSELGLSVMQSLQSIAVINGMPSIYGDAGLALVRRTDLAELFVEVLVQYCPRCKPGQMDTDPAVLPELLKTLQAANKAGKCPDCGKELQADDFQTAVCISSRKGTGLRVSSFSVQDAKRAKLWGKTGPWTEYPNRMMMWRARGFNLRDNFGDVLKGLHTYEEARDQPTEPEPSQWSAPQERPAAGLIPTGSTNIIDVKAEPNKECNACPEPVAGRKVVIVAGRLLHQECHEKESAEQPKKRGRPKGSTNKEKEPEASVDPGQNAAATPAEEKEQEPPAQGPGSDEPAPAPNPAPPAPLLTLPANFAQLEPGDRTVIWMDKLELLKTEEDLKSYARLVQQYEPDGGAVREAIKPKYILKGKAIRGIK